MSCLRTALTKQLLDRSQRTAARRARQYRQPLTLPHHPPLQNPLHKTAAARPSHSLLAQPQPPTHRRLLFVNPPPTATQHSTCFSARPPGQGLAGVGIAQPAPKVLPPPPSHPFRRCRRRQATVYETGSTNSNTAERHATTSPPASIDTHPNNTHSHTQPPPPPLPPPPPPTPRKTPLFYPIQMTGGATYSTGAPPLKTGVPTCHSVFMKSRYFT
jgi:hypothetical protein